jgi:hypothetical protein
VFFTCTVTLESGSLVSEEVMVPVIVFSCAEPTRHKKNKLKVIEMRSTTLCIAVNLNFDKIQLQWLAVGKIGSEKLITL